MRGQQGEVRFRPHAERRIQVRNRVVAPTGIRLDQRQLVVRVGMGRDLIQQVIQGFLAEASTGTAPDPLTSGREGS